MISLIGLCLLCMSLFHWLPGAVGVGVSQPASGARTGLDGVWV